MRTSSQMQAAPLRHVTEALICSEVIAFTLRSHACVRAAAPPARHDVQPQCAPVADQCGGISRASSSRGQYPGHVDPQGRKLGDRHRGPAIFPRASRDPGGGCPHVGCRHRHRLQAWAVPGHLRVRLHGRGRKVVPLSLGIFLHARQRLGGC